MATSDLSEHDRHDHSGGGGEREAVHGPLPPLLHATDARGRGSGTRQRLRLDGLHHQGAGRRTRRPSPPRTGGPPRRHRCGVGLARSLPGQQTGCQVVGTDLPFDGLRRARPAPRSDGLAGRASYAVATGGRQPFRPASFDAVVHTDVLCCLSPKLAVLRACRQLLRPGGRLAFTTIHASPDLDPIRRRRAHRAGPPHRRRDGRTRNSSPRPGSMMSSRSMSPPRTLTRSEPGTRPRITCRRASTARLRRRLHSQPSRPPSHPCRDRRRPPPPQPVHRSCAVSTSPRLPRTASGSPQRRDHRPGDGTRSCRRRFGFTFGYGGVSSGLRKRAAGRCGWRTREASG